MSITLSLSINSYKRDFFLSDQDTIFINACAEGNSELVKKYLEDDAIDVSVCESEALCQAAERGHEEIVDLLNASIKKHRNLKKIDVPDEIILEILSFCEPENAFKTLRLVNKTFWNLTEVLLTQKFIDKIYAKAVQTNDFVILEKRLSSKIKPTLLKDVFLLTSKKGSTTLMTQVIDTLAQLNLLDASLCSDAFYASLQNRNWAVARGLFRDARVALLWGKISKSVLSDIKGKIEPIVSPSLEFATGLIVPAILVASERAVTPLVISALDVGTFHLLSGESFASHFGFWTQAAVGISMAVSYPFACFLNAGRIMGVSLTHPSSPEPRLKKRAATATTLLGLGMVVGAVGMMVLPGVEAERDPGLTALIASGSATTLLGFVMRFR